MLSIRLRRQISSPVLLSHLQSFFSNGKISCPLSTTPNNTLIEFNETTVSETLSCYRNDWKRAMEFFNWVETDSKFQHTTDTYNTMIDILGKFFEFDLSWELIQRMKVNCASCYPNHTTFRVMFKRYVSAHLVNEAVSMYDHRLSEFNLKDEISFSILIDALCEYKHVIEAEELCLAKSCGMKSTKIYNMLLRGWFKIGWWSKCREFWEVMDQRGVNKDLHSYSIYMDIMCKSGKPYKAVNLYKEMKKKKIKLDVVAYNTVIRAIGLAEGVDFSVRIYREMIESGCAPTIVTFNIIIKLLCDNGRVREAHALFGQMSKMGCPPEVLTYHSIFRCLEKPQDILDLFDRMIESGVRPSMDTYVMLMRKFGRWGFLRPLFIVWNKMEEHGCSPDECAYTALIDALVQKNEIEKARNYDNEMLAKGISGKSRVEYGLRLLNKEPSERFDIAHQVSHLDVISPPKTALAYTGTLLTFYNLRQNRPDKSDRVCTPGELALSNAPQEWKKYVCQTSVTDKHTTIVRLNPKFLRTNLSSGNGPFLVDLQDSTFVGDNFTLIEKRSLSRSKAI